LATRTTIPRHFSAVEQAKFSDIVATVYFFSLTMDGSITGGIVEQDTLFLRNSCFIFNMPMIVFVS